MVVDTVYVGIHSISPDLEVIHKQNPESTQIKLTRLTQSKEHRLQQHDLTLGETSEVEQNWTNSGAAR